MTAALEILDAFGLPDLSMRRVATSLGVQVGALYHHVPDKQSLLAAIAERILDDVPRVTQEGKAGIHMWSDALRRMLLQHRDSGELLITVLGFGLIDRQLTETPMGLLRALVAEEEVSVGVRTLVSYVLGDVCQEQAAQDLREFSRGPESLSTTAGDAQFHAGIDVILRGLSL